jgi:hypothetical protein
MWWVAMAAWLMTSPQALAPLPWTPRDAHPTDHGYLAVCRPMRCCGSKTPHASWQGPWHPDRESAQHDADAHNRQFPDHDARLLSLQY